MAKYFCNFGNLFDDIACSKILEICFIQRCSRRGKNYFGNMVTSILVTQYCHQHATFSSSFVQFMVIQQKEKAELKKKMADGLAETPFDRASNMSTRSRTKVKSSFAFSAADNQKPGEMIRQGWDNNSKTRYLYYSSKIKFFIHFTRFSNDFSNNSSQNKAHYVDPFAQFVRIVLLELEEPAKHLVRLNIKLLKIESSKILI